MQAIWVFTVSLPVTIVNATERNPSLGAADYVGWVMWGTGFLMEVFADQQKLNFKKDSANNGRWCDVGVWKYSRHPNYFGEVSLLTGFEYERFGKATGEREGNEGLVSKGSERGLMVRPGGVEMVVHLNIGKVEMASFF